MPLSNLLAGDAMTQAYELTNPTQDETGDGATLTIDSNSDAGTLYSYSKTTPFTGTEAENAAEIIANGVGQVPVVGTNTRVVTGQAPLTPYYAGWVQEVTVVVSPEDFGAVGDGTTDDTVNFQAALTSASNSGATLTLTENATYRITDPLYMWGAMDLNSATGGTIKLESTETYLINVGISGVQQPEAIYTGRIEDVTFDTNTAGAGGGRILYYWRTEGHVLNNCEFTVHADPYSATSSGNNNAILTGSYHRVNITITNNTITADGANRGSEGFGLGLFDGGLIDGNTTVGVGDDPIGLHFCTNMTVSNNTLESVDGRLFMASCQDMIIEDNICNRKANTGYGGISMIYLGFESADDSGNSPPKNTVVQRNTINMPAGTQDAGAAIYVYSPRNVSILDNIINNDGGENWPNGIWVLPLPMTAWVDPEGIDPDDTPRVHEFLIDGNTCGGKYPQSILQTGNDTEHLGPGTVTNNSAAWVRFYTPSYVVDNNTITSEFFWRTLPSTFDRVDSGDSTQTCPDANGLIVSAGSGQECHPWADYDGTTWTDVSALSQGVLLEGTRENLCKDSEDCGGAGWSLSAEITASNDGKMARGRNISLLTKSGGAGKTVSYFVATSSPLPATTIQVVMLAGGSNAADKRGRIGVYAGAWEPLTGSVVSGPGSIVGTALLTYDDLSETVPTVFEIAYAGGAAVTNYYFRAYLDSTTGTEACAQYHGQVQIEEAAFQSSYIPTSGAETTRPATSMTATMAELGLPDDLVNDISGQIVIRPQFDYTEARAGYDVFFQLYGDAQSHCTLMFDVGNDQIYLGRQKNATLNLATSPNQIQYSRNDRLNIRWKLEDGRMWLKVNNVGAAVNDSAPAGDFGTALSDVFVGHGRNIAGALRPFLVVEKNIIFPEAKSDEFLEALT